MTRRAGKTTDNAQPKNVEYTRGISVQQVNISGTQASERTCHSIASAVNHVAPASLYTRVPK